LSTLVKPPSPASGRGLGRGAARNESTNLEIYAPSNKSPWVLYLLECNNGAYYAGITNDLQARFDAHLSGKGARYTRANPPLLILTSKNYTDRSSASIAEAALKNLPRSKKLAFFNE
jgi:putative endonuclease